MIGQEEKTLFYTFNTCINCIGFVLVGDVEEVGLEPPQDRSMARTVKIPPPSGG